MSIFDAISDFFSGGSSDSASGGTTRAGKDTSRTSAGRGSGRGKTARQTVKSTIDSLKSDISMGLSTFGQGKEQQAQSLREQGYSERAIQGYQERTAASQERLKSMMSSMNDSDDRPSPVVQTAPATTAPAAPAAPEQDIGVPKGARPSGVSAAGATEAEAMEAGFRGRKATVGTTPVGLLREPETAGRRSLMGLIK